MSDDMAGVLVAARSGGDDCGCDCREGDTDARRLRHETAGGGTVRPRDGGRC